MSICVHSWLSLGLCCLPLAFLWYRLMDHLRLEWSLNPAYGYGWAMPFLCLYLIWQRLRVGEGKTTNVGHRTSNIESRTGSAGIPVGSGIGKGGTGDSPIVSRNLPDTQSLVPPQSADKSAHSKTAASRSCPSRASWLPSCLMFLGALLWAPTRLIQEANPEWRFVSWALAFIVIGLTLLVLSQVKPPSRSIAPSPHPSPPVGERVSAGPVRGIPTTPNFQLSTKLAFPICFFLVAVPWPTIVEGRLIQWLTASNVAVTIELLNTLGIPAIQHGTLIEITTGVVGVDEACSGIRSFQATLMLSLFFGELYSLTIGRRIVLCLLGFAASLVFNVARTFILTYIASLQGVPAIDKWHDPAGITILVWCFVAVWLASLVMKPPEGSTGDSPVVAGDSPGTQLDPGPSASISGSGSSDHEPRTKGQASPEHGAKALPPQPSTFNLQPSTVRAFSFGLIVWLGLVEVGVEGWYRSHEQRLPATAVWRAEFPADNPTFRELPFADRTGQLLRHDEGRNCVWQEDDGTRWQGIYLRWNPGKIAVHQAKSHTPEVCLSATGRKMVAKSDLRIFEANGLKLPIFSYVFEGIEARVHVFYCLWEDRAAAEQQFDTEKLTDGKRLAPVLAGRRNSGQRTLELAVWGFATQEQADDAVQKQLEKIIRVEP